MRFRYVLLIVVGIALLARAAVDYFEALSNARHEISGAAKGTIDCHKIYSTVQFDDRVLQQQIIGLCEQRANLGSRYVLIESAKAWMSGLWFCNNLHCSEYIFPIMDQIGMAFRYSVFMTFAVFLLSVYYLLPAFIRYLFGRMTSHHYGTCDNHTIDIHPHAVYAYLPPQPSPSGHASPYNQVTWKTK